MADYIDSEAEEEEEEDDDEGVIGVSRKSKKIKRQDDEEDDEEDDDERCAEEMKDLIDDNEVDDESDDDSVIGKRKRDEEDELDDRLEDDDYDLIEENLGVKVQRKKFRRLQQFEDDESDEEDNRDGGLPTDDREAIANELFEGSDEEGERISRSRQELDDEGVQEASEVEEEEYSDPDDFIVDDDGQPLTKGKKKRPRFTDAALQQAQDIFGVEFDFNEFDTYGEDYEEEQDLDYEEEELESERRKTKKHAAKKHTRKSIFEVYEPSELERGHFTDRDNEIRVTDIPERFQLRGIPVTTAEDSELLEEAEWIYKYAFVSPTISNQEEDLKAAQADRAEKTTDEKWEDVKSQPATVDTGGGEDWDADTKTTTTAAKPNEEEDWDAECSAAPTASGGEDWDAEIEASSTAVSTSTKPMDVAVSCSEDWDEEIATESAAADTTKVSTAFDAGITPSEDWDTDIASEPVTSTVFDAGITPSEDWDSEVTDGAGTGTVSSFAKPPAPKKGPSPAEIAANAEADKKRVNTVKKIKEVLNFMRNHHFEVPFIAFYRKEYVEPELNISDLWKIYFWDEKWCQLRTRKNNLLRLFQKMQQFQCDVIMSDPDKPLSDDMRVLSEEDFDRLKGVQTFEELKDVHTHFILYYGQDIPQMQDVLRRKEIEERNQRNRRSVGENEGGGGGGEEEEEKEEPLPEEKVKQATRVDAYTFCRRSGLDSLAKKFGLTPEQFGENLRDNYQRHEVEQYPIQPVEVAKEYVNNKFETPEDVLKAARYMVATQIAREPLVRQCVRETFFERAKINVQTTKKGIKEIDESHSCYTMKYLKNKPVKDLKDATFLKLVMAEDDGLLTINIGIDMEGKGIGLMSYVEEIRQLYHRDEFSNVVQEWNNQRALVVELALSKFLYPVLQKELRIRLLQESRECIKRACCRKLYNWLKMAPYTPDIIIDDDEDYETNNGLRILGIAYVPDYDTASFGAMIDGDGDVTDFIRLPNLTRRKNAWKEADRLAKETDMDNLRKFMIEKKPHVVCVGSETRDALNIIEDIKEVVNELMDSEQMPQIGVELVDNELSKVYMNSVKAESDYRDYPPLLRQAISLARHLQDPLVEYSQLCNADDEIMCLRYNPLQEQIPKEELMNALCLEFVNRTNEVGVDLNRAVAHPHTSNLVQFICGLGPRKATALLKMLKQANSRLENRTNLVMAYHMGPKVFINCAGFIKIDTNSMGDSTDAYIEVLDGSRVHPETYDWARKMAVDALEYDDMAEDANPAGALEEILENPEKLKDLDLDAFAEELERQGFGNRSITLYDIRAELNHRYKDLRSRYRPPNAEEKFNMLTKETPDTFFVGKMVLAKVIGIAHRKPQGEQLDQANPVRNDETGLWQCPFCLKNDFLEVSEVWNHFDAGSCPGQATGVRVRLDNGISGFIPTKFISDKHVTNPEERVQVGMTLYCRVVKINIEKLQVDLTSRSSDLADKNNEWRPAKDVYYDMEADDKEKTIEDAKKRHTRQAYIKRVIVHPSFQNIGFKEAEKILMTMDQGEVIVRPSSKGSDHLTVTWKVANGIYQHIDVREEGKENAFSLGQSLWIAQEEFEDLDEIIARHVQPMAGYARDLINFRYYRETNAGKREEMEKLLMEEKKKAPSKIHYITSASKEYPGKFILSYLPRVKCCHEYITTTPDGLRYRQQMFLSVDRMICWFKEHFRDAMPRTPASQAAQTPLGGQSTTYNVTTPSINLSTVDPQAIQRAAKNMPHQLFNTLTQVASQTPSVSGGGQYSSRYSGYSFPSHPPYTPSQPVTTPMMTPSYQAVSTPGHSMVTTPRYHPTPQSNYNRPHHGHSSRSQSRNTMSSNSVMPSNRSSRSTAGTTTDWGKAAELWAKRQQEKNSSTPRGTPRSSGTPRGNATPMVTEPTGDATPLIDEWPA